MMVSSRVALSLLCLAFGLSHASKSRPSTLLGPHGLGMVMPQLSGWGWTPPAPTTLPPTTLPPTTTVGWTTPIPTTTEGWTTPPPTTTTEIPTTTEGWTTPVPTTTEVPTTTQGWTTPEPTTTVGWTTLPPPPPPQPTVGWVAPTTTPTPGWSPQGPPAGWGWGPAPGWGWRPTPSTAAPINIEMVGESAVLGEGESGATHGSETVVTGDASNPAIAQINTGSYSSLGQGSGMLQISGVNALGETNTFQGVDGYNFGDSGEYYGGAVSGNTLSTLNGGGSFVLGQGAIGQGGFTLNNNPMAHPPPPPAPMGWGAYPYGWKKEEGKNKKGN